MFSRNDATNILFVLILALIGYALLSAQPAPAAPPRPEPHPSACKKVKPKRCKATIVRQPYTYRIVWKITDQDGTITYAPGECTVPVRGPVTCSITITWG